MYPDESLDSDEEPVEASENSITVIGDIETGQIKGNIIKSYEVSNDQSVMYPDESLDSDEEPVEASENSITVIGDIETGQIKGNIIKSYEVSNDLSVSGRVTMIPSHLKYKTNKVHPSMKERYGQVLEMKQIDKQAENGLQSRSGCRG